MQCSASEASTEGGITSRQRGFGRPATVGTFSSDRREGRRNYSPTHCTFSEASGSDMSADRLLDRLRHVRRTGAGRWLACCPAHDDRSASLSVRELEDGVLLVHCFAGCAANDVVAGVGLEVSALFPRRTCAGDVKATGRRGRRIPAGDALRAVSFEADLVAKFSRAQSRAFLRPRRAKRNPRAHRDDQSLY